MRLYPVVFLAFTAAPTRATGSTRVSNSSSTKTNITVRDPLFVNGTKDALADRQARAQDSKIATGSERVSNSSLTKLYFAANDPLFVDGTKDAPADWQVRTQESKNDEKRLPILEIAEEVIPLSLDENMKAVVSKLLDSTDVHGAIPARWSLLSTRDEKVFEYAYSEALLDFREVDLDILHALLVTSDPEYQNAMFKTLTTWMVDQNPEDLVQVLTQNGFFEHFHCAKVEALEKFLVTLNAEKGTTLQLFDTISEGLGGEDKLAYMLSLEKLSPFTGKAAAVLQLKLLWRWKEQEKSTEHVAVMLGLSPQAVRLTYEQLDTLAMYGALQIEKPTFEALYFSVHNIRKKYGNVGVVQAIMDGLEYVQTARARLRERYGAKSTELEDVSNTLKTQQHGDTLSNLEEMLYTQLMVEGMTPKFLDGGNPFELSEIQAEHLRAEYEASKIR